VAASASQIAEVLAGMRAESARLVSAAAQPATARLPAGSPALDALTGGGLPRGRIVELTGPRGSGRMSAVLAMTAAVQATGELVALVDVADALDPRSAVRAGVVLPRLLWVRPTSLLDGLRAADWVLDAGGFGLVVLYAAGVADRSSTPEERRTSWRKTSVRGEAPWIRLARRAERAKSALVVVADRPQVGTVAAVALAGERARPRWVGGERGAPLLLDGVRGRIAVVRSKLGPPVATADVPLDVAARHR
jgi:RecA/RadA recombinase